LFSRNFVSVAWDVLQYERHAVTMTWPYKNGSNNTLAGWGDADFLADILVGGEQRKACMFACHKNVVIMRYVAKCMFVSFVQVLR